MLDSCRSDTTLNSVRDGMDSREIIYTHCMVNLGPNKCDVFVLQAIVNDIKKSVRLMAHLAA